MSEDLDAMGGFGSAEAPTAPVMPGAKSGTRGGGPSSVGAFGDWPDEDWDLASIPERSVAPAGKHVIQLETVDPGCKDGRDYLRLRYSIPTAPNAFGMTALYSIPGPNTEPAKREGQFRRLIKLATEYGISKDAVRNRTVLLQAMIGQIGSQFQASLTVKESEGFGAENQIAKIINRVK